MEIDKNRPRMIRTGSDSLTPAMATMLSRLMMKSAMAIRVTALKQRGGCGLGVVGRLGFFLDQLAGDPDQEQGADEPESGKEQELGDDEGQHHPHHDRHAAAPDHRLPALAGRQQMGRQSDDDRVVAREHQVEQDDLEDGSQIVERHGQAWSSWESRQSGSVSDRGVQAVRHGGRADRARRSACDEPPGALLASGTRLSSADSRPDSASVAGFFILAAPPWISNLEARGWNPAAYRAARRQSGSR